MNEAPREAEAAPAGPSGTDPETVLVTGASSGIGRELARVFAADGARLVLVARREDRLKELAEALEAEFGVASIVLPCDLEGPGACQALAQALSTLNVSVDVLVNNAGFGRHGPVAELELDEQMSMVGVNVSALTELTRLFLPGMLAREGGGILNVASTAAFQPGPMLTVYYATKAFVLSFTEGLAEELRGTGVKVSCLAPGPTETEFARRAGMRRSLLFRMGTDSARKVAEAGHRGLRKGKVLVVPGLLNRVLLFGVRFLPRALTRKVVGFLHRDG
jgi:hypothetical protein